ncbi:bacterial Ig-like domain-containing protein, partial [Coprococcus catus]
VTIPEGSGGSGGTGLSTEVINKLEEVGNYLAYATADGGSKWTELIAILRNGSSGSGSGETVTLQSISATYSGSDVAVGTALTDLTGITVTAHYSDGSTANVTDYTLSGEIAEGSNTITVSYGSKTTTFTVTGVAKESYVELSNSADLWELGGIQPQGTASTSTARLRTIATLSDDVKKISVDDGYSYILVAYSEAQTEMPTGTANVLLTGKGYYNPNGIAGDVTVDNGFLTSVGAYFSGEMIISDVRANINSMYGNAYGDRAHFRVLLKNNDNTTLTADDCLHIHLWG